MAALRHRGLHAGWLSWDDPEAASADLVILRATDDYAGRLDEFLAWTTGVQNLLNAPAVVAWNAERRYLGDLADRGVPTVPGEVVAPGKPGRLPRTGDFFVSPTAGSGTRRCGDRAAAATYAAEVHAAGQSVLVQRAGSAPETVLVFLGGRPSHALPLRATPWRGGARIRDLGRRRGRAGSGGRPSGRRCRRVALRPSRGGRRRS